MDTRLEVVARSELRLAEKALEELERQLAALADLHARDRRRADRLALVCACALTAEEPGGEAVRSFLDYLLGGPAWPAAKADPAALRYASQALLQALADKRALSAPLVSAILDRLETPCARAGGPRAALAAFLLEYYEDLTGTRLLPLSGSRRAASPGAKRRIIVGVPLGGGPACSGSGLGRSGSGFRSGFGSGLSSGFGSGFSSRLGSEFGSGGSGGFPFGESGGYGLELIDAGAQADEGSWLEGLLRALESPEAR